MARQLLCRNSKWPLHDCGKGMDTSAFLQSGKRIQFSAPIPSGGAVCFVDSSFNPPNNAHIKLAHLCREQFPHCVLVLMLSTGNADKPAVPIHELDERVAMMDAVARNELSGEVRLALTTEARFIDKAAAVAEALPKSRTVFAMGFDTLLRIGDQKYYEEPVDKVLKSFFSDVEALVLTREQDFQSKMPALGSIDEQKELETVPQLRPFIPKIHTVVSSNDTLNISSSRARSSVADLEKTTPPSVAAYVKEHQLYGLHS